MNKLLVLMVVCLVANNACAQVSFFDINNEGGTDFVLGAATFNDEIYFTAVTNSSYYSINQVDKLGNLVLSKEIENIGSSNTMIVDESSVYIARAVDNDIVVSKYDKITLDLVEIYSQEYPFDIQYLSINNIKEFNDYLMIAIDAIEANPPNPCVNKFGSLLVWDKISFKTDTIITFYNPIFCSNSVIGMSQVDDEFMIAVEGAEMWDETLPFHELKDQIFTYNLNESFLVLDTIHYFNNEIGSTIWFDLFDKQENCVTERGELILPIRTDANFCNEIGVPPGCIPYNSMLNYKGGELENILRNSFFGYSTSYDLKDMLESESNGLVLYGSAITRFYENYNYTIVDAFEVDISNEPYVFSRTPFIMSLNNEGNLIFRIPTMLDEDYLSNFKDIVHLLELDDGSMVALGNGSKELSPFEDVREKWGDVYVMFMDENFCVEDYGCISEGHTDLTTDLEPDIDVSPQYEVFPNPSNGKIFVTNTSGKEFNFKVYDLNGNELKKGKSISHIDLYDLSKGIYLLEIREGMNLVSIQKVILSND